MYGEYDEFPYIETAGAEFEDYEVEDFETGAVPPLGFVGWTNPPPRNLVKIGVSPRVRERVYLRPEGVGDIVPVATGPGVGMFGITPDLRLRDVGGWRHTFRPHNRTVRSTFHGIQYPGFGI